MNDDRTVTVTIYPRKISPTRDMLSRRPMPQYRIIAKDLRERIESNELQPGQKLPTEVDLKEEYEASRNTVRDAIKLLISQGLVETRPGEGTFVVELIHPFVVILDSDAEHIRDSYVGSGDEMPDHTGGVDAQQRAPSVSPLRVEFQRATQAVAAALQLEEGDAVVRRQEERYIDDMPWSIMTSFYPMRFVEQGAVELIKARAIISSVASYLEETLGVTGRLP